MVFEPAHDRTYNKTCVANNDRPVHPPIEAMVLVYLSLDSSIVAEGTCDQRRL